MSVIVVPSDVGGDTETARLAELPFRWLCESDEVLEFEALGRHLRESFRAVLKPDAILEIPGAKRRLFIEAETGTQSIVTAHPDRTGSVVAKVQRYTHFIDGFGRPGSPTWCQRAFPDDLLPRLLFLVHSTDRKRRVEKAAHEQLARSPGSFKVLVLTFAEATSRIATYFPSRPAVLQAAKPGPLDRKSAPAGPAVSSGLPPAAPSPAPEPRFALAVDERDLRLLRDSFRHLEEALQDAYEAIEEHQKRTRCLLDLDRLPRYDLDFLRKIILGDRSAAPATAPGRTISLRPPVRTDPRRGCRSGRTGSAGGGRVHGARR